VDRHRLRAAVDGEPALLETPTEFRIEPLALRVLVPAEAEA
jgi:diacylglycerol kinase family enzyme